MESPLALYRRYRPDSFSDFIGQEHVTGPLRSALANNRVNHAYLFSGPRGCGKTTAARIMARAINCERAPIADPCGECESCRDLSRGGPGSIDVIEIDAASHGGVDDARDLREKAFFAPVKSRYKVYVIDEAHMVTTQGFNALLKLVEEPPPHLRFIFATTEPEKVLPTIRSRTHHYPFRLFPPKQVTDYVATLCEREGIAVEPAALPLVVRAGAGSMRDTLSVLDQLLGGAGTDGVTYEHAAALLGYTPDTLLDDVVDAFAAGDGAAVFGVVDKVIETGQDPRRFTEDLLRRLRDLVIVAAVPDAPATGLIDVSQDQAERLVAQAARFGAAELSRAADVTAAGLTEMRGATAPRLLLELLCARILLPAADDGTAGVLARLDRLEKRLTISGTPSTPAPSHTPAPAQDRPVPPPARPAAPEPEPAAPPVVVEPEPEHSTPQPEPVAAPDPEPAPAPEPAAPAAAAAPSGGLSLVDVRRLWPDIVDATKGRRRLAWMHLTQNCQVVAVDGSTLTLGFANSGARDSFVSGGCDEVLRQAAIDVVGAEWKIETIVDPGAQAEGTPTVTRPAVPTPDPVAAPVADEQPAARAPEPTGDASAAAREAIQQTRSAAAPPAPAGPDWVSADAEAHPDDLDAEHQGVSTAELLQRELGAQIVEEIPHQ